MNEGSTWRLASDYIGAGDYVIGANRAFVGTEYGVQCLPYSHDNLKDWKAGLGSRCIGVVELGEEEILASCVGGIFRLSREGDVREELLTAVEFIHPAIPVSAESDGPALLTVTGTSLFFRPRWSRTAWEYDFREALGQSIESVRIINAFEIGGDFVVGVVDYDTGIGCVVVLERDGNVKWLSDPGPLSDLFPAGEAVFVWCVTGYGKFETCMTRLDGHTIWKDENMAGVGSVLPDGSLAMLVGSNESPRWDHWEYRHIAANGKVEGTLELRGRCAVRPVQLGDGSLAIIGSAIHLDPTSSRVDYTSFFKMPQEVLFQHLVGIREQVPEYEVYLHRVHPDGLSLDVFYHVTGSFSLATPRHIDQYIVFCDGRDIVGIEV